MGCTGPQLAASSQTGGREGLGTKLPWLPYPSALWERGSLRPDLRVEVTSASTVLASSIHCRGGAGLEPPMLCCPDGSCEWAMRFGSLLRASTGPPSWGRRRSSGPSPGAFLRCSSQASFRVGISCEFHGHPHLGWQDFVPVPSRPGRPGCLVPFRLSLFPPTDTGEQRPEGRPGEGPERTGPSPGLSARPPARPHQGDHHQQPLPA